MKKFQSLPAVVTSILKQPTSRSSGRGQLWMYVGPKDNHLRGYKEVNKAIEELSKSDILEHWKLTKTTEHSTIVCHVFKYDEVGSMMIHEVGDYYDGLVVLKYKRHDTEEFSKMLDVWKTEGSVEQIVK